MRGFVLAVVAIQIGLALPARADDPPNSTRSISEMLPLFGKNHCEVFKDSAEQLFCGDPELNDAAARLNTAIQERLSRLPNRRLAIEENAEWIRDRNSSCGIFGQQSVSTQDVATTKACLLKETEERIEILTDPNFDCLATNTTAGMLICSDPALAIAKMELNEHVVGLIAKLKEDEARDALSEYERWSRERDRQCGLLDKDNVPLDELSSSEGCLANYMNQKTAEIVAAKGDPKKVFGRHPSSPTPDADAVDLCVAQIHSANACGDFVGVNRVFQIDDEVAEKEALITAEVEMIVLSPFAACSPIASSCTGTCWDLKSGKAKPSPGSRESVTVAYRLRIEKAFAFQKTDGGGWRCTTTTLQPADFGTALSGP
ncbi:MAG TPA: lysozyme inhibitor LprI family protein [Bradyrhizobium sp.]|jgi:uncharacterized protein YecT (DUF1311 family)